MDQIIKDLQKLLPFKDTIAAGDIVLIAAKKPQMLVYALVSSIIRNDTKRDEWWHVSMHILSLPPRKVTWILRTPQMTGLEVFTMDGEERFMKAVQFDPRGPKQTRNTNSKNNNDKPSLRRVK